MATLTFKIDFKAHGKAGVRSENAVESLSIIISRLPSIFKVDGIVPRGRLLNADCEKIKQFISEIKDEFKKASEDYRGVFLRGDREYFRNGLAYITATISLDVDGNPCGFAEELYEGYSKAGEIVLVDGENADFDIFDINTLIDSLSFCELDEDGISRFYAGYLFRHFYTKKTV